MKRKELNELKTKSVSELKKLIEDLRKEKATLKIDTSLGKVKNVHSLLKKRKDTASVMTILKIKLASLKTNTNKEDKKEAKGGKR